MKKSTQKLIELMNSSKTYDEYLSLSQDELRETTARVDEALSVLLDETGQKKSDVISRSGIEQHYAYQIFSGMRTPTRDKVIMLCLGFGISVERAQKLLRDTGYAQLYAKNERDNVIIFGIIKGFSMIDINNLLYDLSLEILE